MPPSRNNDKPNDQKETVKVHELQALLRKALNSNRLQIIEYSATKLLPVGENYCSIILRIDVVIRKEKNAKEEKLHLVAKTPAPDMDKHMVDWKQVFVKEVYLYADLVPTYRKLQQEMGIEENERLDILAKYFGHRNSLDENSDEVDGNSLVLMENLTSIGFYSGNRFEDPNFKEPIINVTSPVGREAMLTCKVEDLSGYKVAWLRVDTQTILTIANHVITKNHRISVTHSDARTWFLHIKEVKETDRGWYMCQINTDPMKSQLGYLDVVVPPDIIDYQTSMDMVVREGTNVTLKCAATGSPAPNITWRREDGRAISLSSTKDVASIESSHFEVTKVNRHHMGPYLCIASNGVPPTVSKRITLTVQFPPMISIQNQLISAVEGQQVTLECVSEAYPKSINYWTRNKDEIVAQGGKYEPTVIDSAFKVYMKLTIKSVSDKDFGDYKCISRNSLGDADGNIKLYKMPSSSGFHLNDGESKYKGKHRKNSGNNILEGNQDMLKEKNPGRSREEDAELDYEDSGASVRVFGSLLVAAGLLLLLALHPA